MRYIAGAVTVILLVAVVIFSIQNLGAVDVRLLTWSARVPIFLLVIGSYLLGMVSGWSVIGVFKKASARGQ